MSLSPGTRLGPYEILSPIGAGGMGEVYRAKDTRLDRIVAIKVLPSHLSSSPEIRQRFEREARAISSLSHPHICTLHDIGNQDGLDYLVMEHLEGETLAARLERGPLPLAEILRCAIDVAGALDSAHRQGLVHRDMKPGNIMLTKSGAKLLDFGLARSMGVSAVPSTLTASPTMTTPLTAAGMIVGTFQYMAPEQLEGKEADARTDLFSFGAVLYEMAGGRRAFSGATHAGLIASILKEEPRPVGELAPQVPAALQRIITGCLAKDPDNRWQSAGDLKRELRWIADSGGLASGVTMQAAGPSARRKLPRWMLLPACALLAGALVVLGYAMRTVEPSRLLRTTLPLAAGTVLDSDNTSIALSPDGLTLAFVASSPETRNRVWVRPLDGAQAQALAGTEGASYPFWSPDNRSIGFFADGKLKKIAVSGGTVQTICSAPDGRGASWSAKGVIAFAPEPFGGLLRVPASGGAATPLTRPEKDGMTHRLPHFLPDGDRLLFFSGNSAGEKTNGIMSLDLPNNAVTVVALEESGGQFAPPAHLGFVRDGNLMVQPFDLATTKTSGEAIPIAEDVSFSPNRWAGQFSFSSRGMLVFDAGGGRRTGQLSWFDLEGKPLGTVSDPAPITSISLSPDGKRAAATIGNGAGSDIWLYDLARGVRTRFTFASADGTYEAPSWSTDGRRIAFGNQNGEILVKPADGSSAERVVLGGPIANRVVDSWSPDGTMISVFIQTGSSFDEWIVPVDTGEARPFITSPFSDFYGRFSPDGRWFSYISLESGRSELYVVPYPGPGGRWQISAGGAADGRWLGPGLEMLYQTQEGRLLAVGLKAVGSNLEVGMARPVFGGASLNNPYAVSADGTRLLVAVPSGQTGTPMLNFVVNWSAALSLP